MQTRREINPTRSHLSSKSTIVLWFPSNKLFQRKSLICLPLSLKPISDISVVCLWLFHHSILQEPNRVTARTPPTCRTEGKLAKDKKKNPCIINKTGLSCKLALLWMAIISSDNGRLTWLVLPNSVGLARISIPGMYSTQ